MRAILLMVCAIILTVRLAWGFPVGLLLQPMLSACVLALVPFALRFSGSVRVAAHLLVGYVTLMLAGANLATGAQLTGVHFGAGVLPLIAVVLLGVRGGAFWTLICLAQMILGFQLQRLGYEPLTVVAPQKIARGAMLGPIVVTIVIFGVAAWFEWTKSAALSALTAARDEADRANAAKSQFLSHMSHELRTPMNGVVGALQILRGSSPTEDQAKYLDIGRDSARHMIALLNDILDVSKLEAGALSLESIDLDLSDLAVKVLDLSRPAATAKGVDLRYRADLAAGSLIVGDPLRIRQVVTNIVNNASKFTADGYVELTLSTRYLNGEVQVEFRVEDSGIGIAEEKLPRLFRAFSQVETSTTRRFGGTGLGLRISLQLVEMMGGTIEVQSEANVGSTFTVRFCAPAGRALPAPTSSKPLSQLGLNILVAEDNPVNRKVIGRMLSMLGCESIIVENGQVAVDLAHDQDFDCVLMDCQMPTMDGYQATAELRAHGATLPIIALTAHASAEDRAKCLAVGMSDVLSKPVSLDGLADTLDGWCSRA